MKHSSSGYVSLQSRSACLPCSSRLCFSGDASTGATAFENFENSFGNMRIPMKTEPPCTICQLRELFSQLPLMSREELGAKVIASRGGVDLTLKLIEQVLAGGESHCSTSTVIVAKAKPSQCSCGRNA